MKNLLLSLLIAATASLPARANHPDSVFIRPVYKGAGGGFRVEYSVDKRSWIPIDKQLFSSDFGTWGAQKKMYTPVLSYDGKKFKVQFLVGADIPQVGVTESDDLVLWKPQDYPYYTPDDFKVMKQRLEYFSKDNVVRVPYSIVERLNVHAAAAKQTARQNDESLRVKALEGQDGIRSLLNIRFGDSKAISSQLYGIFFEDINYSADGGLYGELIQNRDFEYNKNDRGEWNGLTAWHLEGEGTELTLHDDYPLHPNNCNYAVLKTKQLGASLVNDGWDGISVINGEKYNLSIFIRNSYEQRVAVSLVSDGKELATATFTSTPLWQQQTATLVPSASARNAKLVIKPLTLGDVAIDFVSLFPDATFKGRKNGLRKDLAQTLANLKPKFVRFPGGCLTHGNGIDNIYHWQATIGELWERQSDFNIWNYHQTRGLGFFEYFQFCEDIGAEPLPVLAAGVPCQNSSRGGHGQQGGIPFIADLGGDASQSPYSYNGQPLTMESYLQELLDLIEWANGDASVSPLAKKRADAGHAEPFNLKYLGIGNEDLLGDVFNRRFEFLYNGIRAAHPEITVVGTVGPFWEGSDYEYGWREAKRLDVPVVDEHYYNNIGWYLNHQDFYDKYSRTGTKVYLGEWASWGNRLSNALAEAIHITNLERNADVVVMSSYAPLLAREGHTQWNPDLIYFDNTMVKPTPNYYVQMMCGQNAGNTYVFSDLKANTKPTDANRSLQDDIDKRVKVSVVADTLTNEVILKIVNALPVANTIEFAKGTFDGYDTGKAVKTMIEGREGDRDINSPRTERISLGSELAVPAYSFTVLRVKKSDKAVKKEQKEAKKAAKKAARQTK